jgi:hypothetical protein
MWTLPSGALQYGVNWGDNEVMERYHDLTLFPPNAAPISAPLVPTLTYSHDIRIHGTRELEVRTNINDTSIRSCRTDPFPNVS